MAEIMISADLAGWWGLSLQQTLLIAALILILVDVFFQSDAATHVGYILAATAAATWLPIPPLWRLVVGLLAWGGFVYLHYSLWRDLMANVANRFIAPTRYRGGVAGLVGQTGEIKQIESKAMLQLHGDLWNFHCDEPVSAGDRATVQAERDGILHVERVTQEG